MEKGEQVGFEELKIFENIGIIFYTGVLPEYRRKGYGKKLAQKVEDFFKSKGLYYILASTRSNNKPAIRLFSSLNYNFFDIDNVSEDIIYILNAYDDIIVIYKELVKKKGVENL